MKHQQKFSNSIMRQYIESGKCDEFIDNQCNIDHSDHFLKSWILTYSNEFTIKLKN